MNMLAVIGTMRKKGDSYHVIKRLEESLERAGGVTVDYLFLADHDLGYCLGCEACFRRGEQHCPKRKLTGPIEEALVRADGVILASPVYDHQVTALMKNFFDHFAYFFHRPRFFGKPAILLSTTGQSGLKETLGYLRFTALGWGYEPVATLGVISGLFHHTASYREKVETEIKRAAQNFVACASGGTPRRPGLYNQIFFRAMRLKAGVFPCDRLYWEERGWFKSNYFVDVPVNPFSLAAAKMVEVLMRRSYHRLTKRDSHSGVPNGVS